MTFEVVSWDNDICLIKINVGSLTIPKGDITFRCQMKFNTCN